jgi:hypothetical protein
MQRRQRKVVSQQDILSNLLHRKVTLNSNSTNNNNSKAQVE